MRTAEERTTRVTGAVRRVSVPLTEDDERRIHLLRSTASGRAVLDLHARAKESAVLARILAAGLQVLEDQALEEGYAALAEATDAEDRAFVEAVRRRRAPVDTAWPADGPVVQPHGDR